MNSNNDNSHNAYNELSIVINQQAILAQKVGILLAINTLVIGSIISLSANFSWWYMFFALPEIISLLLCTKILMPNFKPSSKGSSKYFYDFAKLSEAEVKECIKNEDNTIKQIIVNSKILKDKYNLFKHSLAITFLGFPYLFLLFNKIKRTTQNNIVK